ncbi:MAG TPA: efflux RND transporter periplasmic adaptor subunit [Candidatus Saccharimonadales bacterium]|nr:efflux RND transporter periplasmic adaptor subunit [Candidatus Saccharimonadales bacterium]
MRNRILIFLAAAAILAYTLIALSARKPVVKISTTTPARENLSSSISSNGKVEPVSPFVMRAPLDTFVDKVLAMEGQTVRKGQLLIQLNVHDAAAQLADAKSKLLKAQDDLRAALAGGKADDSARVTGDLLKAQAERDRLQKNHDALERLIARQAATADELAVNDLALTKAQSEVSRLTAVKQEFGRAVTLDAGRAALQVQQAQSEVASLSQKVASGRIVAPANGTLYSLPAKTRDFVKTGDLLAEMADLHKVRVRAFIDEPELGALEPDQSVKITWDALPNRFWTGKTEVIPKQVVARGARSVGELLCAVNNDKLELLPNINVDVKINSKERANVLSVPRGTVISERGKRFVYVVKANELGVGKPTLEKREIQVGIADATNYEVVSGLKENDLIALPGDVELHDGMAVKVMSTETGATRGSKDDQ